MSWKTTKKLPPIGEKVLVFAQGYKDIMHRVDDKFFASGCLYVPIKEVKAWLPIKDWLSIPPTP
jgi:hypothetical protein